MTQHVIAYYNYSGSFLNITLHNLMWFIMTAGSKCTNRYSPSSLPITIHYSTYLSQCRQEHYFIRLNFQPSLESADDLRSGCHHSPPTVFHRTHFTQTKKNQQQQQTDKQKQYIIWNKQLLYWLYNESFSLTFFDIIFFSVSLVLTLIMLSWVKS